MLGFSLSDIKMHSEWQSIWVTGHNFEIIDHGIYSDLKNSGQRDSRIGELEDR